MGTGWRVGFGLIGIVLVAGAAGQDPPMPVPKAEAPKPQEKAKAKPRAKAEPEPKTDVPAGIPLNLPGIENAFRISPRIYSGGQPSTRESFRALKDLGIKTILTVDGAAPDVAMAHAFGMTYVHIPIGYDGVPRDKAVRLALAVKDLPGPIFLHCHHGKHRGPAAVAVCAAVVEGWSPEQGTAWMQRAGTSPDYPGLYESIANFKLPSGAEWTAAAKLGPFPESVKPPATVDAMVEVDTIFDRLKAAQKANFPPSSTAQARRDATLLREQFSELLRLPTCKDPAFQRDGKGIVQHAEKLESALDAGDVDAAHTAMNASIKTCTNCHKQFRDVRRGELNRQDAKDAEKKGN